MLVYATENEVDVGQVKNDIKNKHVRHWKNEGLHFNGEMREVHKNGEKQKINADKASKKMKVVKELTLVSLIDEVSEFFLKSSKQDGDKNKKI